MMLKSALLGIGLVAAIGTIATAQTYSPYYYPGYTSYPGTTVNPHAMDPYTYYNNYVYPGYATSPYYSPPTPYNDPYVASRPYSDGAGPRVSDHVGY